MSEIKASALIYCRTYYCDYDTGFLLRPEDFSDSDVAWVKTYILSATSYCDELKGIRQVVFGNEKYLVFGIVGVLNWLFENVIPENKEIKQYALDEHGRNIKCFIGYVCHMPEKRCGEIPLVRTDDFVKIFTEHIARETVWKNKSLLRLRIGYEYELRTDNSSEMVELGKREYVSSDIGDRKLFETVLSEVSLVNVGVSLCTNLYNVKMLQDKHYSYVTAQESTIERYKKKVSDASAFKGGQDITGEDYSAQNDFRREKDCEWKSTDKTTDTKMVVQLAIVVIIVLLIFLIKGCC